MKRKVVVLGGGTGLSSLLRGLKEFPVDLTAIVFRFLLLAGV